MSLLLRKTSGKFLDLGKVRSALAVTMQEPMGYIILKKKVKRYKFCFWTPVILEMILSTVQKMILFGIRYMKLKKLFLKKKLPLFPLSVNSSNRAYRSGGSNFLVFGILFSLLAFVVETITK